jgi:hypothetical protein
MVDRVRRRYKDFKEGFVHGLGWSFGVTVGFVIVSTIGIILLRMLGGLPLIGDFIASVTQETQISLERRSVIAPK